MSPESAATHRPSTRTGGVPAEPAGPESDSPWAARRVGYGTHAARRLDPAELTGGWSGLLSRWLEEARTDGVREPNAMVLATVGAGGTPSTRCVLCKSVGDDGVTFYTQSTSRKGRQIALSPRVSVTFPLLGVERQVHLEGVCTELGRDEVLAYWSSRPRGARLAAWASEQSRVVDSATELDSRLERARAEFGTDDDGPAVPLPDRWTGYRIDVLRAEFWQGGADRFHDRLEATAAGEGWAVHRLQP